MRRLLGIALVVLVAAGCEPTFKEDPEVTVSGVVQKGLFETLQVNAFTIDPATALKGEPILATIEGQTFVVEVPENSLILLEAKGTFTNELTGQPVILNEPLQTLISTNSEPVAANINVATTIASSKTINQLTNAGLPAQELIDLSNAFVTTALSLPPGTDPTQLDYNLISGSSTLSDPNLQLLLLSGAILSDLAGSDLFQGDLGSIVDEFVLANSLEQVAPALNQLSGVSAQILYDNIQASGLAGNLPLLDLADNPVWKCDDTGCGFFSEPAPKIYVSSDVLYEAEGMARVNVRLGMMSTDPVDVGFRTVQDTASTHLDFGQKLELVTIPAGEYQATVEIPIPIDALTEGDEQFFVRIESNAPGYTIDDDTGTVTIHDGAPPLSNPAPDQLTIANVCVNGFGAPGAVTETGCAQTLPNDLGISTGNGDAAAVEIDLAATCATTNDCPPRERNWLVNFFLVAKNAGGAQQSELPLGPYVYGRESVQLDSAGGDPRHPLVAFNSNDVVNLLRQAGDNSWQLEIEARIGPADQLVAGVSLPSLTPVPARILAGDTYITVNIVESARPGDGTTCSTDELEVTAKFTIDDGEPGALSAPGNGTVCIAPSPPGEDGYTGVLTSGEIDMAGATVPLADGHSGVLLAVPVNQFQSSGSNNIWISNVPSFFVSYLHYEGWPFMFRISGGTINATGIELDYDGMRYIHDVGYSTQDRRSYVWGSFRELRSNDIWYAGVKARGMIQVNADGTVDTSFLAEDDRGHTAFPKAAVEWERFPQTIENSVISNRPDLKLYDVTLEQNAACASEGCAGSVQLSYSVEAETVPAALDPRGFVLGPAVTKNAYMPGWGAHENGDLAWQRPDDWSAVGAPLTLALPGYRMPGQGRPTDFLLAHLDNGATEHALYPRGTLDNTDGNYFPTGLSFGPKIYRDANGIPDVGTGQNPAGNDLRIDNQSDVINLASAVATKYVIRNSGATGVFNADPDAVQAPLGFYGYALELDRFAVRLVDNSLDTFNWVDGSLALNGDLGGPDGLRLFFSNLEINCGARLGNANLTYENCDARDNNANGITDENCGHRLYGWSADTEIFSMAFSSASACQIDDQFLTLNHQVGFAAVDRPVGLEGQWDSAGKLVGQQTELLHAYRLDARESVDKSGFAVKPDRAVFDIDNVSGSENGRYGWIEMRASKVGVPFWNAIDSNIRLANRLSVGIPTAEPTVMSHKDQPDMLAVNKLNRELQQTIIADSKNTPDDDAIFARYEWGNTGFGFQLPVYYSPWQFNSDQSQFLGVRREIDLFVLDAGAGIDFIDPVRTKLSFGASADFEKLGQVRFSIDLSNPESLRKVDNLLVKLNIVNNPVLEPAMTELQDKIFIVNRYANKGINEVMQQGLETALEELGKAAAPISPNGEDPFVTASKAMAQLKSMPDQALAIVEDGIKAPIDDLITNQESALRNELQTFENQITQLQNGDPVPQAVFDAITTLEYRLNSIADSSEQVAWTVGNSVDDALELIDTLNKPVTDLKNAATSIDQILLQATVFAETACRNDDISGGESAGYLDKMIIRLASVRRVFQILESDELLIPLTELLNNDPELRERIEETRRDIRAKTEELAGFLNDADAAIKEQVCNPQFDTLLAGAKGIVTDITTHAEAIEGLFGDAKSKIEQMKELADGLYDEMIVPIQQVRNVLSALRLIIGQPGDSLDFIYEPESGGRAEGGAGLIAMLDAQLTEISNDKVTAIVADPNSNEADLLTVAFGILRGLLDEEFRQARDELIKLVDNRLPGAYFTPEELRRMLVTKIMASQPIENLRAEMNQHFTEINYRVNNVLLQFLDQLNYGIRGVLAGVETEVNKALDTALAPVRNIPLKSAGIDGYGVIAGNELERAHVGAEWTMKEGAEGQEPNTFGASLDAVSWSANNKAAGCGVDPSEGRLDVTIAALGLPATIAGNKITMKKVYLGFNLANTGGTPPLGVRGVYGGLSVTGDIKFSEAKVYDPAFAAGIGDIETYLGASAGAVFSDIQAEVAFLIGRTCNADILMELDPKVATFITLPPSGFAGAYLRGAASIPLLSLGCPLVIGVGAEFGSWILAGPPLTAGGLVGGAAYGKVACIGALRGQIRALGQVNSDGDWSFAGEGFGAAGVGWCDPASWTTVERSRDDDFCATGDAQMGASFSNGKWKIQPPKVKAIF